MASKIFMLLAIMVLAFAALTSPGEGASVSFKLTEDVSDPSASGCFGLCPSFCTGGCHCYCVPNRGGAMCHWVQNRNVYDSLDWVQNRNVYDLLDWVQNRDVYDSLDWVQNRNVYDSLDWVQNRNVYDPLDWVQNRKEKHKQPLQRFELWTPGLQDQYSNH
ncbi:predicted protein [Nematostella vectensis]|uniref:Uncharacterized protein n=1 Tax=Nematostella vectensis TaxID=45351 RepID=A7RYY1_NEMVE|nr:predicted protein [Nematostella vectensis]|eukprot:XP_001635330.1 predicted protein [Nematostella vectensis]